MCTITENKPELRVAEKDITVYKYVDISPRSFWDKLFGRKVVYSAFYYSKYILGKIYKGDLDEFIFSGKHYKSGRAFYSYSGREMCNAECIIPKGSKYYKATNLGGGKVIYHSDQIKIVRLISLL